MFGIERRNNRKIRLSNWFARERDGDMQALDVHGVASGLGVLCQAIRHDVARRRAARAIAPAA